MLLARAAGKMKPRPDPFSTRSDYTSWDSLTDRRYDARHLGPVVREPDSRVAHPAHARSASSAMTRESWPPCQASGLLPSSSTTSDAPAISSA